MANPEHLSLLTRSVADWNQWRKVNTDIRPDLSKADLSGATLGEADLTGATLIGADLSEANLSNKVKLGGADLSEAKLVETNLGGALLCWANLSKADLSRATLSGADLTRATLSGADLSEANLMWANLSGADLAGATLERSIFVRTTCNKAIFTGCRIHGISAWDLKSVDTAEQANLIITPTGEPDITVDNLEVGQFIYLLLNNQRIRHVIDTITSKVVLILGRFTPERKVVLNAIRDQLRRGEEGYIPVLFDFEKPRSQTTLETINTLASMARFVIADITDAKSVLQELQLIVPHRPMLPIQPLLLASQEEPGMFDFFRPFPWFLKPLLYRAQQELLESLQIKVILPAEQKAKELIATQRN